MIPLRCIESQYTRIGNRRLVMTSFISFIARRFAPSSLAAASLGAYAQEWPLTVQSD
jgi:hypothetical protein